MNQILPILCAASLLSGGHSQSISISTQAAQLYYNPGDTATLSCRATNVPTLAHMEWKKNQRDTKDGKSWVSVSRTTSISENFAETSRVSVTYTGETERDYNIQINGVQNEDVGWYRCEVHSQGTVMAEVIHTLNVYRDIDAVTVMGDDNSTSPTGTKTFFYKSGEPGVFSCQVTGGYPSPSVEVYVGTEEDHRMETGLSTESHKEYEGDTVGLQRVNQIITQSTNNFNVRAEDDGKVIQCDAKVRDERNQVMYHKKDSAVLSLSYKPEFTNPRDYSASANDADVVLAVVVHAKPQLTRVVWESRRSGLRADSDQQDQSGLLSAYQLEGDHRYIATLTIVNVEVDHIDNWDVTAYNELGDSKQLVRLIAGERDDFKIGGLNNTGGPVGEGVQTTLPNITVLVVPLLLSILLQLLWR